MTKSSLRTTLILPYAALVALIALVFAGISWWLGEQTLNNLSTRLMRETARHIGQVVQSHMSTADAAIEAAFPQVIPSGADIRDRLDALRSRLWVATSLHTDPSDYVYYGNELGQFIGLRQLGGNKALVRIKTSPEAHRSFYHQTGHDGTLEKFEEEQRLYDPRQRDWYRAAREQKGYFWTPVYLDFSSRELVVTRARQVLDAQGSFVGAAAVDLHLSALNTFVSSLDVGKKARIFIVNQDGVIIASNSISNLLDDQGKVRLLKITETQDEIAKAGFQRALNLLHSEDQHQGSDNNSSITALAKTAAGEVVHLAAQHIHGHSGLDWIAVVALPRVSIMERLRNQMLLALGLGILAVVMVIVIGMRIFGRIGQDIALLSTAVDRIRRGELDTRIEVVRNDEIGQLDR